MARPKVLVIDDEPHVTILIELAGRDQQYEVVGARTLEEGRAHLAANPDTAMLLLDVRLPDGSGLDLLDELRADARFRDLPIVVLTGTGQDDVIARVEAAGARCITKPFSPSKLARMVTEVLDLPTTEQ